MSEMYEVWVYWPIVWNGWKNTGRMSEKDADNAVNLYAAKGFRTRVTPTPIMTADHWVEMREV